MRSDLEKLDSFTLETSRNHLIRNFLSNGRLRVKKQVSAAYLKLFYIFFVILTEKINLVVKKRNDSYSTYTYVIYDISL